MKEPKENNGTHIEQAGDFSPEGDNKPDLPDDPQKLDFGDVNGDEVQGACLVTVRCHDQAGAAIWLRDGTVLRAGETARVPLEEAEWIVELRKGSIEPDIL